MVSMKTEAGVAEAPSYDCCPCIYLNDDQVEALGIKGLPAPGTVFTLQCRAVVESITARAEEADEKAAEGGKPDVSLSLKITDMAASRSGGDTASMLYGG
jgi:hypothetical protein